MTLRNKIPRLVEGAMKYDSGKPPVFQGVFNRFPRALLAVANVSDYGKRKYGTFDGWEKVPDGLNRYLDAEGRHILLRCAEGEYDVGNSDLAHAAQVAWNALATLEMMLRDGTVENRTGKAISPKPTKP